MASCLPIGLDRLLLNDDSWTDQLTLILAFVFAFVASIYLLFGWFDLEAHISNIQTAIHLAATQTIDFVSIDTSESSQAGQPRTPEPLAKAATAVPKLHVSSSVSSYSTCNIPIPNQWVWERSDWISRPGEFSQRKLPTTPSIFKTETEKSVWYEALAKQPTTAQRRARQQQQRDEALKKWGKDYLFDLAVETPLPPDPKRKRKPLCAPRGYQKAYKRFSSIFGPSESGQICRGVTQEAASGHLNAGMFDILPPRYYFASAGIEEPTSVAPAQPAEIAPTNIAPATTTAFLRSNEPAATINVVQTGPVAADRPPAPALCSSTPPAAPTQADITSISAAPSGGDPPIQSAPSSYPIGGAGAAAGSSQSALRPPGPAAAPTQPDGTNTSVAPSGGDAPVRSAPGAYPIGGAGAGSRPSQTVLCGLDVGAAPEAPASTSSGAPSSGGDPPPQATAGTYPPGQLPLPQTPLTPANVGVARIAPSGSSASGPPSGGDPLARTRPTADPSGQLWVPQTRPTPANLGRARLLPSDSSAGAPASSGDPSALTTPTAYWLSRLSRP